MRPNSRRAVLCKLWLVAEEVAPRSLLEVDVEDLEQFLDRRSLVPRTRYHYISALHGFYEWAVVRGVAPADPTLAMARPRLPRHLPRPITDGDLRQAMREAPPQMRAMLVLGAYQGLRCAEIANLQREHVLDTHDPAVLMVQAGKGGHDRVLPLHEEVMPALRVAGLPRAGHLFCYEGTTRPLAPWIVSRRISAYLGELGIDATAHQLRHWFGTKVYAASRDLRVTQELLGHASPNTTTVYVAFSHEDARRAVSSLDVDARAER